MARRLSLPRSLWSSQGPVPVTVVKDLYTKEEAFGLWDGQLRTVSIDKAGSPDTQLQTLCHELTEIVIWDSGLHNVFDGPLKEAVCDAVGTYLASAVAAGYIKLTVPK